MSETTGELIVLGILLLVNGLFAMAEIAVVSARKARLKTLADDGDPRAQAALELASGPTQFLSMVQFGMTLCTILLGTFSGAAIADHLTQFFGRFSLLAVYAPVLSYGVVVAVSTAFTLVFGELVPKRLALSNPEKIAMAMAGLMKKLAWLATPAVWALSAITDAILGLFGVGQHKEAPVTEDEVTGASLC